MQKVNQDITATFKPPMRFSKIWFYFFLYFWVALLLHQSFCLVKFSWISFVFQLLLTGVTVSKEMHPEREKKESVGRCAWDQVEVLLFCMFCTVTGRSESYIRETSTRRRTHCGTDRKKERGIDWIGIDRIWKGGSRVMVESFYRFTIFLLLTCWCWGEMQTVRSAHLSFSVVLGLCCCRAIYSEGQCV